MCCEAQMVFLDMQKMVSWYVVKKNSHLDIRLSFPWSKSIPE